MDYYVKLFRDIKLMLFLDINKTEQLNDFQEKREHAKKLMRLSKMKYPAILKYILEGNSTKSETKIANALILNYNNYLFREIVGEHANDYYKSIMESKNE